MNRLLLAARRAAFKLLPPGFPREKIDLGFQGAIGIVAVWEQPFDEPVGPLACSTELWGLWVRMFLADVENVNRALLAATLPPPVALFDLNDRSGSEDGQARNVLSFPPRFS